MADQQKHEQYEHCMVMAGGGFRFGYYLGMHAAAVEQGRAPDLLLASCGGAIAAALIQSLPTDAERRAWLASRSMHGFLRSLGSTPHAHIGRVLAGVLRRRIDAGAALRIPDLFNDYLFELPAHLPLPPQPPSASVDVAIVGARLLYEPGEAGQQRAGRALFEETVFASARAAGLLDGAPCAVGGQAIAATVAVDTHMPLPDAVRISIADMFYFRSHGHGAHHYTGGVIDLFPIELAHRLARRVSIETKAPFHQLFAIPALRAVFGIDGNARLRHVHGQPADTWIDTTDVSRALRQHGLRKRISLRDGRVHLAAPQRYADYVHSVEAQWRYGYERMREALAGERRMRNISRHNWSGA
ncbi:MAG: hypothetical protein ACLGI6_16360 [Gammaproteobacteria bacterium]